MNPSSLSHTQHNNQLIVSSLSNFFDIRGRYTFQNGQHDFVTVIKQLTSKGVWLIGFRGHVLRAHSQVPLLRGARIPVTLHLYNDTLLLHITQTDTQVSAPLNDQNILLHNPQFQRAFSMLIEKGFTRHLLTLATMLMNVHEDHRVYDSYSRHQQNAHYHHPNDDSESPAKEHASAGNKIKRSGAHNDFLTLFNYLPGVDAHWMVFPIMPDFSLYGSIRVRMVLPTRRIESATVVGAQWTHVGGVSSESARQHARSTHKHAQWAIHVHALHTSHQAVTVYAQSADTLARFNSLIPRIARRLSILGVTKVEAKAWSNNFDGFDRPQTKDMPVVNIHV